MYDEASSEPRLGPTLRSDLRQKGFWRNVRQELDDLKTFYVSDEQRSRLEQMSPIPRAFSLLGWLLRSMLLKLTPVRRILLLVGFILVFVGRTVTQNDDVVVSWNWHIMGGFILVFVFMLELKDKLLARTELEAGRKVQAALMPDRTPHVPGWSVWLFTQPANEVGGDLVDSIRLPGDRTGLVIADVTGKGLQAALLMAKLQATIRALAPDCSSVSALVSKINQIFHRDSLPNVFASMLYLDVSPDGGIIRLANAGHLPPVILLPQGPIELTKGEAAVGLMGSSVYTEHSVALESGDVFFVYSDGLTEARNAHGDFFGADRLLALLPSLRNLAVSDIAGSILDEVRKFVGNAPAYDDISFILLKRT